MTTQTSRIEITNRFTGRVSTVTVPADDAYAALNNYRRRENISRARILPEFPA